MHEEFHLAPHSGAYFSHLFEAESPFENHPLASKALKVPGPLKITDGALSGGVHRHLDVPKPQKALLAEDDGVNPGILSFQHQ